MQGSPPTDGLKPARRSLSSSSFLETLGHGQFREKFKHLQESCDYLNLHLRKITDTSRNLGATGSLNDAAVFADELLEFAFSSNDQKDGGMLSSSLKSIGSALKDLQTLRSTLLGQMEQIVTQPLVQFVDNDIKSVFEMRKKLSQTRDLYDAAQLKYDLVRTSKKKKDNPEKAEKLETELSELKRAFECTSINYINKLTEIDAKKSFQILERLCTYMYAEMSYFHQGYVMLTQLEPSLRELMGTLEQERMQSAEKSKIDSNETLASKISQPCGLEKQGHIFFKGRARSGGMRWKRRWFVLSEGILHNYKNWKEPNPLKSVDLLLASVKIISDQDPPHKPYVFTIVWPNKETMMLQAVSDKDRNDWIEVLQNSIGFRLKQTQNKAPQMSITASGPRPYDQLREVSEANCYCADCSKKDGEWASVSLGTVICEECAGVHRGLGVHISRVRSLTLDKWEPELLMLMKTIGNSRASSIWEYNSTSAIKPVETSDRETKEKYIRAKYEQKQFIQKTDKTPEQMQQELYLAVMDSNVMEAYRLMAQGASPDWTDPNKRSMLHLAIIEGKTDLICLELLIQSGAKVHAGDKDGRTPLHYAAMYDRAAPARLLLHRGADPRAKDNDGKTAENLAIEFKSKSYLTLILSSSQEEDENIDKNDRRHSVEIGETSLVKFLSSSDTTSDAPRSGPILYSRKLSRSSGTLITAAALKTGSFNNSFIQSSLKAQEREKLQSLKQALMGEIGEVYEALEKFRVDIKTNNDPTHTNDVASRIKLVKCHLEGEHALQDNDTKNEVAIENGELKVTTQKEKEEYDERGKESKKAKEMALADIEIENGQEETEEKNKGVPGTNAMEASGEDNLAIRDNSNTDLLSSGDEVEEEQRSTSNHNEVPTETTEHQLSTELRNEGTGGDEEKNYQRQLLMECIKEEKYIESSRPRFRERRLSQGAEFDREGEVNFINRDRRSKEILISINEYRKSREMTMRDYRKSREYPSDYKKEKDDLYREEKEKVEKKDREKESVYDSISGKVKDWATRRRQGMGNKKRGSAEVVYVASNPLHHFLKVNANQREKEERERELAELHKST